MHIGWVGLLFLPGLLPAQNGATVEGAVTDSATGAGIAGASVQLLNQPNKYQTTSDAAGRFRITDVVPGKYRANADKDGFSSQPPGGNFLLDALNSGLLVAPSADPIIVNLKLTPLTTVRGRISLPDGSPAPGVEVFLSPNIFGSVITDEEGRFALENIRAGEYVLSARPPAIAKPEELKDGTRTALVATYYPSVSDSTLALQLKLGATGGEYDIRMQTAPVRRVRGIVLDGQGKPSLAAEVILFPASEGSAEPIATSIVRTGGEIISWFITGVHRQPYGEGSAKAIADKEGRFEFSAVPSGSWEIRTGESRSARASAGVIVGRADVEDLQLRMITPFNLTGAVEWKGDDPAAKNTAPGVRSSVITLVNADTDSWASAGFMDSRGLEFENLLPGRYKAIVKTGLSAQLFLGGTEVTGQTFALAAGGPPMRVVLRTWSGAVRGVVEKCGGATVVLLPQGPQQMAVGQFARCSDSGSFELTEVSPGDYYIAAFDRMDGLSPSATMLNLMPSRGSNVKVEEGATANITLSVIPAPR